MNAITLWRPRPNEVYCMDALTLMHQCEPGSVDAIITDLPYGTTACTWDTVIPFEPLWAAVKHCLKPRGVFVTTASQPFTSALVMSNPEMFKYGWIWDKINRYTGFLDASRKPLRRHEDIVTFASGWPNYYPQITDGRPYIAKRSGAASIYSSHVAVDGTNTGWRYPSTIIAIPADNKIENGLHPTQKPVALYEYLIRTYTQPGELVLDPTCGSGTTGLAARNTGRRYLLGDSSAEYAELARLRITGTGIDLLNAKTPEPLESLPLFAQAVNA